MIQPIQLDRHHRYHRTVRPSRTLTRSSLNTTSTTTIVTTRPLGRCLLRTTTTRLLIMLPVLLSVITRALVTGDSNCFGGVETFERIATTDYAPGAVPLAGVLLQQENMALTRDCINLCRQQQRCSSFTLDYRGYQCASFAESSRRHRDSMISSKTTNLFEKVCLKGISKQEFDHVCGHERLWAFERVKDSFLEGFVEKELSNMVDKEECAKACLTESGFICRSADFDEVRRICRLSKENRRTQPQAFVTVKDSQRDYLENQCAPSGLSRVRHANTGSPASCIYMTRTDTNVFSMDTLQFASSAEECQLQCDRESSFNCRAYGFLNNRCMLSSDDEKTIGKTQALGSLKGATFGEKTCVAELCTNGIFTYEKITGHVLRSAITTPVDLPNYSSFGVTGWCRESCDQAQLNCPAFTINYANNRCERIDRNTQGRANDLIAKEGESYFEKICLRVPQIMTQCQDKFWAFERVLGHELAPVLYVKTLNFVQSRRDCEEYCLQEREFPCRSALYNDETTECRLSPEDRRTSPGHYYRSRSMKVNYLENQCVRAHSSCPYVRTSDSYPTYTDIVETASVASREMCEKMCNDNRHFLCRSYAYYSSNGQCFLSGDDSASAGAAFVTKRSSIMYYERKCSRLPGANAGNGTSEVGATGTADPYVGSSTAYPGGEGSSRPMTEQPSGVGSGGGSSMASTVPSRDMNGGAGGGGAVPNVNKEVVITNGTLGGIITTRITRFPENLVPTLPTTGPYGPGEASTRAGEDGGRPMGPTAGGGSPNRIGDADGTEGTGGAGPSDSSRFPFTMSSNKKCPPNARFLFEKVTSFEPIGGHLTLLYSDLQSPGIVTECAKRCEHSAMCRAFVVDYYHQTCHGLFENSSVGALDLRLSMGKDYYEGFCVPSHVHCDKFWPFDRIIDQMTIGARPEDIVRFVSRSECRTRCLEERKFRCLSASYNSFTHECHLYSEDRNSGALSLQFNKGIDFMENQCAIEVKDCRYHPIERDISIVSVTKSVRGTSTFHCEQACDYEKEFNCRSYTYLDNPDGSVAPGGNLCLLSADNRATSHQGSMQFRPRALYAEKDCAFQRGRGYREPSPGQSGQGSYGGPSLGSYASQQSPRTTSTPSMRFYDSQDSTKPTTDRNEQQHQQYQQNARHMGEEMAQSLDRPSDAWHGHNRTDYRRDSSSLSGEDLSQLQHIPLRCALDEFTFEKTFGHDLRYARRERAPIAARPGVLSYCREECLRMADRCKAFIVEYGDNQQQNCYFLDEAASEHRNQLNKLVGSAYSEKICLREKTCGKIWSFERIIGYMLDEPSEKEFSAIMLRTSCQDLCLAERSFVCRSITYDYGRRVCKLFKETRRSRPNMFKATTDHIDYFENKCVKDTSTCQYRAQPDRYLPYPDRVLIATSLSDCQRHCDSESSFHCKSVNFDPISRECLLSSEDTTIFALLNPVGVSFPRSMLSSSSSSGATSDVLQHHQDSIFSEKGNCEQVSVQCNQQDMLLTLNFEAPFTGRVYTKANPAQCFVNGNGQTELQFAIPLSSRCGTHQESTHNYVNEVIVQQHSVIMTDNDRTIRVLCSFEMSEQTIRLGSAAEPHNILPIAPNGIDVSANANGRSYKESKTTATLVANTAAPPTISMRIVDGTGRDAQVVSLGDDLMLRIELKDPKSSSFGMFARNLYARSSAGESLFLIDSTGCPVDGTIFPALRVDPADGRSLVSKFKAFRFPSTGVVNFEVQIRFCQEACEPPSCPSGTFASRRRKRAAVPGQGGDGNFLEVHVSTTTMAPTSTVLFESNVTNTDNSTSKVNTDTTTTTITGTTFASEAIDSGDNPSRTHNNLRPPSESLIERGRPLNKRTRQTTAASPARIFLGFSYPTSDYVRYYNNSSNRTRQQLGGRDEGNRRDNNNNNSDDGRPKWTAVREEAIKEDEDDRRGDNKSVPPADKDAGGRRPWREHNEDYENLLNLNLLHPKNVDGEGAKTTSSSTDLANEAELMTSESTLSEATPDDQVKEADWPEAKLKTTRPEDIAGGGGEHALRPTLPLPLGSHSKAALPLPASAGAEVPLSLAIMVDDSSSAADPAGGQRDKQLFDEPASTKLVDTNDNEEGDDGVDHYTRYDKTDNTADVGTHNDKLQTRKDLVYRRKHNGSTKSRRKCSSECPHTGLVIFLTTLIVTIVHLTLFTTVYVYMSKLRSLARRRAALRQQRHCGLGSSNGSLSPSSISSSIGSLSQGDAFSYSDENGSTSVYCVNQQQQQQPQSGQSGQTQPSVTYFGMEPNNADNSGDKQPQPPANVAEFFGSLRSKYNRDNVFFGPKEQRFLGLPNYAFGGAGARPKN